MGSLFTSFSTGVSGIRVAQSGLNVSAHNIANADTKGYVRQQLIVSDHKYINSPNSFQGLDQTGIGTNVSLVLQRRNALLDGQFREQSGRLSFYEVRAETVSEMQELFGELNGQSFANDIQDIWSAFQELSKTPDDITSRELLISQADAFLGKCQMLYNQIDDYQVKLNSNIKDIVAEVNRMSKQIHEINADIVYYQATGQRPNDLYDARNEILDELSKYVPIFTKEYSNGVVTVNVEGIPLVTDDRCYRMTTEQVCPGSDLLKPVWENNGGGDVFREGLSFNTEALTDIGMLKGILVTRGSFMGKYTDMPVKPKEEDYTDENGVLDKVSYRGAMYDFEKEVDYYNEMVRPSIITTLQTQLDTLVHGIITTINDALCPNKEIEIVNADGETEKIRVLDEEHAPIGCNKEMGHELFVRSNYARYTDETVTLTDGTSVAVRRYNEEDPDDVFSMYTLSEVSVNSEIIVDSAYLPLIENTESGFAGGYASSHIADLIDKWDDAVLVLDPEANTPYSFMDYYIGMIGTVGTSGKVANHKIDSQTTLVNSLDGQRQSLTSVSTDEELVDLVRFQHMYSACSRYITVIDEMLETLIVSL
ncbi:MAG: flagellar hook-associated protein FlgK [Lachnospiraceae bacterium]|nr:flagellar hook-associated protein FlgK [Lachnospiraceae bacterium]